MVHQYSTWQMPQYVSDYIGKWDDNSMRGMSFTREPLSDVWVLSGPDARVEVEAKTAQEARKKLKMIIKRRVDEEPVFRTRR